MKKEIVLVIGGSKGIGEAIVKRIAGSDRKIIFTYFQSRKNAEKISKWFISSNLDHSFHQLDISDPDKVNAFVEEIGDEHKQIDILINNAGIVKDNPLYLIDNDDWDKVISTNLNGVFFVCRAVSKYMIRRRRGVIVNISSIVAKTGSRGQANYCASKGGVESLTRSLAVELARKNIRVNCVSPGVIETGMTKHMLEKYKDIITSGILLNRIGKPEEAANVVNFLISADASYINGQIIHVDGGML